MEDAPVGGLPLRSINFSILRGQRVLQPLCLLIALSGIAIGAVTGFRIAALASTIGNSASVQGAPALHLDLLCLHSRPGSLAGA